MNKGGSLYHLSSVDYDLIPDSVWNSIHYDSILEPLSCGTYYDPYENLMPIHRRFETYFEPLPILTFANYVFIYEMDIDPDLEYLGEEDEDIWSPEEELEEEYSLLIFLAIYCAVFLIYLYFGEKGS